MNAPNLLIHSACVSRKTVLSGTCGIHNYVEEKAIEKITVDQLVKKHLAFAGAAVMKSIIFWDITPFSLMKVNRRFGGTCILHLPGRRIIGARNQPEMR
jgi:hypothetical protein